MIRQRVVRVFVLVVAPASQENRRSRLVGLLTAALGLAVVVVRHYLKQ
jgi:hypothetical protein